MKTHKLIQIHESLVNGQRRQMVEQIDDYGVYDFWAEFDEYLQINKGINDDAHRTLFVDATVSYFRIKAR